MSYTDREGNVKIYYHCIFARPEIVDYWARVTFMLARYIGARLKLHHRMVVSHINDISDFLDSTM